MLWSGSAWADTARLGGGGGLDLSLTRIVLSLLLCLGIALSVILLLKRNGGRMNAAALRGLLKGIRTDQRVRVIESRRISAHADFCLVRCDDVEYVILSSTREQKLLREQPAAGRGDA
ncbi:hypothetical protein OK349_19030 [Sphingomonas sp. BT-65]|uniref:hypothetical protein n=1 Tax=Sphingomonas sp. BT-65 TaxID=2989821 RepID=UPI002235E95A|nr:hypothetical protein [Sphingomonas sp. BT-65]MCW4463804.1 hypothetical protein [Sphingomonas sp. BT-65]